MPVLKVLGASGVPALFVAGTVLVACSTSDASSGFIPRGTGGNSSVPGGASGGTTIGIPGTSPGLGSGGEAGSTGTQVECTDGVGCVCPAVAVALLGKPGQFGDSDSTAFMAWLNSSSAGTAKVDHFPDRQILSADFLAGYSVIILLGLGDDSKNGPFWAYDASEVTAVQDWITAGGGLITLTGASGVPSEVDPQNQLLKFSGIAYRTDWVTPDCTVVDAAGLSHCNCGGQATSINLADFKTNDTFVSQLATGITRVGVHGGRSIVSPEDAHVAATFNANSGSAVYNALVGKAVGTGRILAFTDEWITYTSQWSGTATTDPSCIGYMPPDVFQTAQFWFNMIKWVQPNAKCFTIVDKGQDVIVW